MSYNICFTNLDLNSRPQLKEMYALITPAYAAQWKVIGTLLGMAKGRLDTIESTYPINLFWCCNKMLETWLETDTTAVWKDVIAAIDSPAVKETQSPPISPKNEIPKNITEDIVGTYIRMCVGLTNINSTFQHKQ